NAIGNDSESLGISRCVIMLRLLSCTNSIGVPRRMRSGGHDAPAVLCWTALRVNSKKLRSRPSARRIMAQFLFNKLHDHRFEQTRSKAQRPQKKSCFQKSF